MSDNRYYFLCLLVHWFATMICTWVKADRLYREGKIEKYQEGAMFQLSFIPGASIAMLLMPEFMYVKRTKV